MLQVSTGVDTAPPVFFPASTAMISFTDPIRAVCLAIAATVASAADHPGPTIYKEHCGRCHGDSGVGTKDLLDPLVGDLIASFWGRGPDIDDRRGRSLVYEQIDPQVCFHFGVEGPAPERFQPNRFAIRWIGSTVAPETGLYAFVVRTERSVRLAVNTAWHEPPLIDAYVKSADETEYRATIFLIDGRAYPLGLEFSQANQGVDNTKHEPLTNASIELL